MNFLPEETVSSLSSQQLITAFASKQGEILRKVFTHYADEKIGKWRESGISDNIIRQNLADLVVGRNFNLLSDLKKFVEKRLFDKLGKHSDR